MDAIRVNNNTRVNQVSSRTQLVRSDSNLIDFFIEDRTAAKTLQCSCGQQAKHYHHHKGYTKKHWLDVIPVCTKCHSIIHLKEKDNV